LEIVQADMDEPILTLVSNMLGGASTRSSCSAVIGLTWGEGNVSFCGHGKMDVRTYGDVRWRPL